MIPYPNKNRLHPPTQNKTILQKKNIICFENKKFFRSPDRGSCVVIPFQDTRCPYQKVECTLDNLCRSVIGSSLRYETRVVVRILFQTTNISITSSDHWIPEGRSNEQSGHDQVTLITKAKHGLSFFLLWCKHDFNLIWHHFEDSLKVIFFNKMSHVALAI